LKVRNSGEGGIDINNNTSPTELLSFEAELLIKNLYLPPLGEGARPSLYRGRGLKNTIF
jgi:hypothetical protein